MFGQWIDPVALSCSVIIKLVIKVLDSQKPLNYVLSSFFYKLTFLFYKQLEVAYVLSKIFLCLQKLN